MFQLANHLFAETTGRGPTGPATKGESKLAECRECFADFLSHADSPETLKQPTKSEVTPGVESPNAEPIPTVAPPSETKHSGHQPPKAKSNDELAIWLVDQVKHLDVSDSTHLKGENSIASDAILAVEDFGERLTETQAISGSHGFEAYDTARQSLELLALEAVVGGGESLVTSKSEQTPSSTATIESNGSAIKAEQASTIPNPQLYQVPHSSQRELNRAELPHDSLKAGRRDPSSLPTIVAEPTERTIEHARSSVATGNADPLGKSSAKQADVVSTIKDSNPIRDKTPLPSEARLDFRSDALAAEKPSNSTSNTIQSVETPNAVSSKSSVVNADTTSIELRSSKEVESNSITSKATAGEVENGTVNVRSTATEKLSDSNSSILEQETPVLQAENNSDPNVDPNLSLDEKRDPSIAPVVETKGKNSSTSSEKLPSSISEIETRTVADSNRADTGQSDSEYEPSDESHRNSSDQDSIEEIAGQIDPESTSQVAEFDATQERLEGDLNLEFRLNTNEPTTSSNSAVDVGEVRTVNASHLASSSPVDASVGLFNPGNLTNSIRNETVNSIVESVVDSIAAQVTSSHAENEQSVLLEIEPVELGRLQIHVGTDTESVKAQIVATELLTSELLMKEKHQLVSALQELGIELSDVEISHRNSDNSTNEFSAQSQREHSPQHHARNSGDLSDHPELETQSASPPRPSDSMIDVVA